MWSIAAEKADLVDVSSDAGASFSAGGRGTTSSKLFPLRAGRAETRNRAKDELRRVINAVERVRKWSVALVWDHFSTSSLIVFKGAAMGSIEG